MANKKTREREINAAKVKVYENKKKSLKIMSPIAIAIIAASVLLMFVPFIEIMNDPSRAGQTGAAFVEQEGANGFTCLIIALTRDYTSAESALSPYYYWVADQGGQPFVKMLTIASFVALLAAVLAVVADVIVIATKKHEVVLFALVCDFIATAAFIMAFVAALSCKEKMIAVGEKAKLMHEKTHENIRTIRPLRDGVIADFYACEQMMRGLIKQVNTRNHLFSPSLRMVIGVPSGSTEVELRAVRDSAEHAGGRDVYLIFEPMAAAIGIGIDVEAPEGNMIVDIGGGSTEIAVISLGGIVSNNSIRIAGDDLTADIQEYMSRQHNVKVSERMAERIKINVGAALTELGEDAPEDYIVHGPNRITALPMEVPVCYQEVAHCLEKSISKIETAILSALENTPPELYADIVHNGIYLAGGGALLRGLDKRLTDKINIPFHIAEDPLHAVAKGTGVALKNVDRFSFLMR